MGIDFQGRVAIVTGAGGGLGRQHALALAKRGAKVLTSGGMVATPSADVERERVVLAMVGTFCSRSVGLRRLEAAPSRIRPVPQAPARGGPIVSAVFNVIRSEEMTANAE